MKQVYALDGRWELHWTDGERGVRLDEVLGEHAPAPLFEACVPGEVHGDLVRAGLLADPSVGLNSLHARWVEETTWVYRRVIDLPAVPDGAKVFLHFGQLDLAATILVNGQEVGRHANAFRPARFDVTAALKPGRTVVVVEIESGLRAVAERPWQGYGVQRSGPLHKRHWLRKTQSSFSWDWAPRLVNVGITGSVCIEYCRGVWAEDVVVLATVCDTLDHGMVTARFLVRNETGAAVDGQLRAELPGTGWQAECDVAIAPGAQRVEIQVPVADPQLWWPVGHGAPMLYEVQATLTVAAEVVGQARRRVGFRHVRVNQEAHPAGGSNFIVEINGRPVFCKGGNFVPADIVFARITRADYRTLVERALECHMNMLRVWGGGLYEGTDFYELCDETGILVWQEFIFACAKYPATDETFLADVKHEATHQVRRLAHHPSLVVWCGNNEMEWGNWDWGYEKGVAHPDHALFHLVLPRIVAREDGTRFYQPSSPFSPGLAPPNADDRGDQHPWSVGFRNTDFRDYRRMTCRFPNEGGILGPTALPTVHACLVDGQRRPFSFAWQVHDNSIAFRGWADTMLEQWLGVNLRELSLEDYVYWGGLVQGAGLAEYIRNFRRRMFDSAAAIFWMYNDCWPAVRSWTVIDGHRRRTPSFHPVRRAFAPVAVFVAEDGERIRVFGVNEGPAFEAELRWGVFGLGGGFPLDTTRRVTLRANASTALAEFGRSALGELGETTHGAFAILASPDGRELARDTLFMPLYREVAWPEAAPVVQWQNGTATFSSPTFAWRVCLDLDGDHALPDNFFDLLPGVPYVLAWPEELGRPRILRVGNALRRPGGGALGTGDF